jgi:ribosomal protein S19
MPRSFWKGKFIPITIFFKFKNITYPQSLVCFLRNIYIFKHFFGCKFVCYNGCDDFTFFATKNVLLQRVSSFIVTRKFGVIHVPKKTKKQKQLEEQKRRLKTKQTKIIKNKKHIKKK